MVPGRTPADVSSGSFYQFPSKNRKELIFFLFLEKSSTIYRNIYIYISTQLGNSRTKNKVQM
jgi:hypothetical protein